LQVALCYRNRDKLRPDGPLGSHADLNLTLAWSALLRFVMDIKMSIETEQKSEKKPGYDIIILRAKHLTLTANYSSFSVKEKLFLLGRNPVEPFLATRNVQ